MSWDCNTMMYCKKFAKKRKKNCWKRRRWRKKSESGLCVLSVSHNSPAQPMEMGTFERLLAGECLSRRRCLSRLPTFGGWRHGEGYLLPATHQSDRRTFSTISGNSWGLPIHLLRGFGIFSNEFFSGISSSIQGRTRQQALYFDHISGTLTIFLVLWPYFWYIDHISGMLTIFLVCSPYIWYVDPDGRCQIEPCHHHPPSNTWSTATAPFNVIPRIIPMTKVRIARIS